MHSALHQPSSQLEYLPDNSGLEEFDVEDGEREAVQSARPSSRPSPGNLASSVSSNNTNPATGQTRAALMPARLYAPQRAPLKAAAELGQRGVCWRGSRCAVVLVAIPSGTPVGTEVLPALPAPPVAAEPVRLAEPAQAHPVPGVMPTPEQAEPNGVSSRAERPKSATPAAPRARVEPAPALELARLREALATLNGLDITLEHCEVRLASSDSSGRSLPGHPHRGRSRRGVPAAAPRRVGAGLRPRPRTLADRG